MRFRRGVIALVAMVVASVWFVATPASATPAPVGVADGSAPVIKLAPPSAGDASTREWPVVSQKFCFTQNVFDQACIQAISQNGLQWTGLRGSYELGLSRPASACFGLNVALVSNRGTIGAASGQTCFGRPLVREFLNLPLFGGYCGQVGFQDQQLGYVFGTPRLCFT